jgi:hypothetical protein
MPFLRGRAAITALRVIPPFRVTAKHFLRVTRLLRVPGLSPTFGRDAHKVLRSRRADRDAFHCSTEWHSVDLPRRCGAVHVRDATCPALHAQFRAAEKGVPFMPLRGLIGSDVLAHRPDWKIYIEPRRSLSSALWGAEASAEGH